MGIGALSPTNDKRIALVYMIFVLILIFGLEAWTYEPVAGSTTSPGGGGGQEETPLVEEIVWEDPQEVFSASGSTNEGQTDTESFNLDEPIIREVKATLSISDDVGQADTFSLTMTYNGEEKTEQGTNSVSITFSDTKTFALNGSYEITIAAIDCPNRVGLSFRDGQLDWQLTVEAEMGTLPED